MIEQAAGAIFGAALFVSFALFGRWIVQDPRRAFNKFWPDDPHLPHKQWKFTFFRRLGYFGLFAGVMNATAVVLMEFLPHWLTNTPLAFVLILLVALTMAIVVLKRSLPRAA